MNIDDATIQDNIRGRLLEKVKDVELSALAQGGTRTSMSSYVEISAILNEQVRRSGPVAITAYGLYTITSTCYISEDFAKKSQYEFSPGGFA